MSAQVNEDSESQRGNIFHSRCDVKGKFCSIIINNSKASREIELPYLDALEALQDAILSEKGEMIVDKQVSLAFTLEKYSHEILCDVVPWRLLTSSLVGLGSLTKR
ncbi:hypothetical protein CR513_42584, partial [Mucuna pruriens]